MSLKNARFIKYPEDDSEPIVVRKLTQVEKDTLLEELLEKVGGDTMSDLLYEKAQEATQGKADSITWD